jgi:hypothetical protein
MARAIPPMHQPGIVGTVGGGMGVGEGTAVGNGGSDVSVSVGAAVTVFVAVGGTVEVNVRVIVAAGRAVLVATGGIDVLVGGGAVGTVCALAVPTQPEALAARITTPRASPAAMVIRGDSVLRTCDMVSSLDLGKGPSSLVPGVFQAPRQRAGRLTGSGIHKTMPARWTPL